MGDLHYKKFKLAVIFLVSVYPGEIIAQVGANNDVLNPNIATESQLASIPQLNSEIAEEIIDTRPFLTMVKFDEFLKEYVSEIERKELYRKLFIPINLNSASEAEILLVPGVGNRMKHEFEEYRPYKALAQFRREMGKYVDDDEVARLEQFVFVPINLNQASDEAILSVPGLGDRMLHEFKEYRPYKNIGQFRREIGKYVDDNEVARLERYVTL